MGKSHKNLTGEESPGEFFSFVDRKDMEGELKRQRLIIIF